MAKVLIEIEDFEQSGTDKVKVTTTPTFETMMAMDISGSKLTAAHGYAFSVINHIMRLSKENGPIIRSIPKLIS